MSEPDNRESALLSDTLQQDDTVEARYAAHRGRGRLLAGGGFLGALLASSCCVAPLLLVSLGVGGAWMGSLTALAPYKVYFLSASVVLLAGGFWYVYFKPGTACAGDAACERPAPGRITRMVLWLAAALVILSATIDFWAPLFY